MKKEYDIAKVEKLLKSLPSPELPESLTAENLFARIDSGELALNKGDNLIDLRDTKVFKIKKYLKPIAAYASVFVLAVFVYYVMGLDNPQNIASQVSNDNSAVTMTYTMEEETTEENKQKPKLTAVAPQMAKNTINSVYNSLDDEEFYTEIKNNIGGNYYPPKRNNISISGKNIEYNDTSDKSNITLENTSTTVSVDGKAIDIISLKNKRLAVISVEKNNTGLSNVENKDNISSTNISLFEIEDSPKLIYSLCQEGEYIKHNVVNNKVVVATYKPIDNESIPAPLIAVNDEKYMALDKTKVHKFDAIPNNEYILLSYCNIEEENLSPQVSAILGNNMTIDINGLMKTITVFANDIKSDIKKISNFNLSDYKVTLS